MSNKPDSISEDKFADGFVRANEHAISHQLQRLMHEDFEFTYDAESRANIEKAAREVYQGIVGPLQARILELENENKDLKESLLDCFGQACSEPDGKYDHSCLSSYEEAQYILLKYGVIKPEQCNRP